MKDKHKPAQTGPSLLLFASVHPPFWAQLSPSGQKFFRPEEYVIHVWSVLQQLLGRNTGKAPFGMSM